eukprot:scaffold7420_cov229-Pinguiococcus_pyrenoidosus.AAC.3
MSFESPCRCRRGRSPPAGRARCSSVARSESPARRTRCARYVPLRPGAVVRGRGYRVQAVAREPCWQMLLRWVTASSLGTRPRDRAPHRELHADTRRSTRPLDGVMRLRPELPRPSPHRRVAKKEKNNLQKCNIR